MKLEDIKVGMKVKVNLDLVDGSMIHCSEEAIDEVNGKVGEVVTFTKNGNPVVVYTSRFIHFPEELEEV